MRPEMESEMAAGMEAERAASPTGPSLDSMQVSDQNSDGNAEPLQRSGVCFRPGDLTQRRIAAMAHAEDAPPQQRSPTRGRFSTGGAGATHAQQKACKPVSIVAARAHFGTGQRTSLRQPRRQRRWLTHWPCLRARARPPRPKTWPATSLRVRRTSRRGRLTPDSLDSDGERPGPSAAEIDQLDGISLPLPARKGTGPVAYLCPRQIRRDPQPSHGAACCVGQGGRDLAMDAVGPWPRPDWTEPGESCIRIATGVCLLVGCTPEIDGNHRSRESSELPDVGPGSSPGRDSRNGEASSRLFLRSPG